MRVVRVSEVQEKPLPRVVPHPGWTGGQVTRTRQDIVLPGESKFFTCGIVNSGRGATTGFHTHSKDQILIVTSGIGIVATEHEEREVKVGDIVYTPAGERHWHGATKDSYMSHINITGAGSQSLR